MADHIISDSQLAKLLPGIPSQAFETAHIQMSAPLQIQVVGAPPDITSSVIVPLLAAFFGALAAFALNWLEKNEKQRRERIDAINRAIYSLVITNNTLLNFKGQLLNPHVVEFKTALGIIVSSNPFGSSSHYRDILNQVDQIFGQIGKTDPEMSGVLKQLEEIKFI